jgi:hypothetical protein
MNLTILDLPIDTDPAPDLHKRFPKRPEPHFQRGWQGPKTDAEISRKLDISLHLTKAGLVQSANFYKKLAIARQNPVAGVTVLLRKKAQTWDQRFNI